MTAARLVVDPLWQCLCPSWTPVLTRSASRWMRRPRRPVQRCLYLATPPRNKSDWVARKYAELALKSNHDTREDLILNPLYDTASFPAKEKAPSRKPPSTDEIDYAGRSTQYLYGDVRSAAIDGKAKLCRYLVEQLVRERREKPNLQMYNSLILSNISYNEGAAWRVSELLDEMQQDGLEPDSATCHAVLKVLSVHIDHLLRTEILEHMGKRWYSLSEDGAHDVAAGLLREGLFEQGLERMDNIRKEGMLVQGWLLDMAVYMLCEANEISEAFQIMSKRFDDGEMHISRSLWLFFLDKASEARHHSGTHLAWSSQANQSYINPPSGVCLNVLATASQVADAVMATEVFTHLSKRDTAFDPIHYELLISTYLGTDPADVKRALTILTIMALEKMEPTSNETRGLYMHLRDKPPLLSPALDAMRELHDQDRKIPIAALNLLIECYVEQSNLEEAMKVYKQIHTFNPITKGAQKSYANIETFNLLLKGCRTANPPDEEQASFLVSELLALRIKPTSLTYDRLILVYVHAGLHANSKADTANGQRLIDWAYRHFVDMRSLRWMPRFGTLEKLSIGLAQIQDEHCWDVLQSGEDNKEKVDGWDALGHLARRNVERAWEEAGAPSNLSEAHDDNHGITDAAASLQSENYTDEKETAAGVG